LYDQANDAVKELDALEKAAKAPPVGGEENGNDGQQPPGKKAKTEKRTSLYAQQVNNNWDYMDFLPIAPCCSFICFNHVAFSHIHNAYSTRCLPLQGGGVANPVTNRYKKGKRPGDPSGPSHNRDKW